METGSSRSTFWYLLQCKPRQDGRAALNLQNQGYQVFNPQIRRESTGATRRPEATEPLFPGYLFIRLAEQDNWAPLRSTRGVSRVVSFNNIPARVTDEMIAGIEERCRQPLVRKPHAAGDRVLITQGPLQMLEGIFLSMNGQQRVLILLQLLNRKQPVQLSIDHIRSA